MQARKSDYQIIEVPSGDVLNAEAEKGFEFHSWVPGGQPTTHPRAMLVRTSFTETNIGPEVYALRKPPNESSSPAGGWRAKAPFNESSSPTGGWRANAPVLEDAPTVPAPQTEPNEPKE